ncbi:MAG TPA: HD domain-containing protein, partial [Pseudomonadales bacterium]
VDRLFGVVQPAKYHPEIDTGVHTLMVLEQAARLSPLPIVRFAALVHDLGKALSPHPPLHTGHEAAGAGLIESLAVRLRVPKDFSDLGILVSLQHTRCHRADRHEAEDLFLTLELCDALRRPERFGLFLLACEADARGRLGLENAPYPQAGILRGALAAAKAVDIRPLVAEHTNPKALVPAIRAARIAAIDAARITQA